MKHPREMTSKEIVQEYANIAQQNPSLNNYQIIGKLNGKVLVPPTTRLAGVVIIGERSFTIGDRQIKEW